MKTFHFFVLMLVALLMDTFMQSAVPGVFWLAQSALISSHVTRLNMPNSGLYYFIFALIIDVSSGLHFGFVLLALLVVWITMQITATWLRTGMMLSAVFLLEFLVFMIIPLGVHDTIRFALPFMIVSLAPISVVAGITI